MSQNVLLLVISRLLTFLSAEEKLYATAEKKRVELLFGWILHGKRKVRWGHSQQIPPLENITITSLLNIYM